MICLLDTGGDEFIILARVDRKTAEQIAERIRNLIKETEENFGVSITVDGQQTHLTLSLGVAEISPALTTLDILINNADRALYHSKHTRDKVTLYNLDEINRCSQCQQRLAVGLHVYLDEK